MILHEVLVLEISGMKIFYLLNNQLPDFHIIIFYKKVWEDFSLL
jgi:hypothetical protein